MLLDGDVSVQIYNQITNWVVRGDLVVSPIRIGAGGSDVVADLCGAPEGVRLEQQSIVQQP